MQPETPASCPECGSRYTSTDGSEVVCNGCGLVLSEGEPVAEGPRPGTLGGVAALPGKLGVTSSRTNKTSYRNLAFALAYIRRLCGTLGLPQAAAVDAIKYYQKAASLKLVKGRNIELLACAIIFHVSREIGCARLMKEICRTAGLEAPDGFRTFRMLSRQLGFRPMLVEPEDFVHRFANGLGMSEQAKTRALGTISWMKAAGFKFNGAASTIAAAAVYAAGLDIGEHRSFKDVAKAIGVSESCMRSAVPLVAAYLSKTREDAMSGMAFRTFSFDANHARCFLKRSELFDPNMVTRSCEMALPVARHRSMLYGDFLQQADALFR